MQEFFSRIRWVIKKFFLLFVMGLTIPYTPQKVLSVAELQKIGAPYGRPAGWADPNAPLCAFLFFFSSPRSVFLHISSEGKWKHLAGIYSDKCEHLPFHPWSRGHPSDQEDREDPAQQQHKLKIYFTVMEEKRNTQEKTEGEKRQGRKQARREGVIGN